MVQTNPVIEGIPYLEGETKLHYVHRVAGILHEQGSQWGTVANQLNGAFGLAYSETWYRKGANSLAADTPAGDIDENPTIRLRKERMKLSDERIQVNADLRRISREETLKEIAMYFADTMSTRKAITAEISYEPKEVGKEAILLLSDWHYGLEVNSPWNTFNKDVCVQRVKTLKDKVILKCHKEGISRLTIANLSDLICGRIHYKLRVNSWTDVISQTMEVAEILAEFLVAIASANIHIDYYDCSDNHSRIEPNKKDALSAETFVRVIKWYLSARLSGYNGLIEIHDNNLTQDIMTFVVCGRKFAGVHGDKDSPQKLVQNITLLTGTTYEAILSAHLHHVWSDEHTKCYAIGNGTLMGSDEYAEGLRLTSNPSQTMLVVSEENGIEDICIIKV